MSILSNMSGEKEVFPLCPVCHSPQTSPVLMAKDYTVSGEAFTIHQCAQCSLRFTFPVPDQQHIGRYYKSEDYISHTDTAKGIINKLYHAVRKYALQQKKNDVVKATGLSRGNILDVGCGTGAFLHTMKQAGWSVTGLEPDEQARTIAQQKYKIETLPAENLFELPEQSFDVITLWHVLEHIHQLDAYMEKMHKLLKPGGKLFIAVPNYTSLDAGYYQAYWAAYDVPRHLYHFSPSAISRLAERHYFLLSRRILMPFDPFYISLLSEKYKHGKPNYVGGFIRGLRSWIHARKNPLEGSSLIYVLNK